jgi:hypothetical protein
MHIFVHAYVQSFFKNTPAQGLPINYSVGDIWRWYSLPLHMHPTFYFSPQTSWVAAKLICTLIKENNVFISIKKPTTFKDCRDLGFLISCIVPTITNKERGDVLRHIMKISMRDHFIKLTIEIVKSQ